MYNNRRMIIYVIMALVGIAIVVMSAMEVLDSFYSGFGGGITAVAVLRLVLGTRYRKDEKYAEATDIANNDERTLFIVNKAKSWSFYLTIIFEAIAGVILRAVGQTAASDVCFFSLCIMTLIYWIAYMILNKKY